MAGTGTVHLRDDADDVLLRVENLHVRYAPARGRTVQAVSGISFDLLRGETLGLVGESGCGKSSTGRAVMQIPPPTSGSVRFEGAELTERHGAALRAARRRIQLVFQDPVSSLNPTRRVRAAVGEGLAMERRLAAGEIRDRVDAMLEAVGLDPAVVGDRRPRQFSGGQSQRICIARALTMQPSLLICDEPVASLDVSVQAQILNLLEDMKRRFGLTLLFIAHDLAVIKSISDRVLVMYLGKVCELAAPDTLNRHPAHPYTQLLLDAVPRAVPVRLRPADVGPAAAMPSPVNPPSGCRFRTRCPRATERCANEEPMLRDLGDGHYVACHFPTMGAS